MPAWWTMWLWQFRPFGYIRFTTSCRKSHVFYVRPAMLKKRTILSFDQCASCRALAIELVRQKANSTFRSKNSGHKEPSWPSGIRAAVLIWNTWSAKSWITLTASVRVMYNTSAVILLWCIDFRFNNYIPYIIMTMHDIVLSMNIAGGDVVVQGALRLAPPNCPSDERPPVMYGHFCLVPRVSVHDRYYCIWYTTPKYQHLIRAILRRFSQKKFRVRPGPTRPLP